MTQPIAAQNGMSNSAGLVRSASVMLLEVLAQVADVLDDPVVSLECATTGSDHESEIIARVIRLVDIVEAVERDLEAAAAGALVAGVSQLRVEQECASFTSERPGARHADLSLATLRLSLHQARLRIARWLDSHNAPSFVHSAGDRSEELETYLRGGLTELVLAVDQLDHAVGVITPLSRQVLQLTVSEVVAGACERRGFRTVLEYMVDLATAQRLPAGAPWRPI